MKSHPVSLVAERANHGTPPAPPPSPIFKSSFNVLSGKLEWQLKPNDYDFHQEIARSGYADMLHDLDRNRIYFEAIKAGVKHLVNQCRNLGHERFIQCLDIGTGSGLLSMMVVSAFHELNYSNFHIVACECFEPMAQCAKRVIVRNSMDDKITIVPKRSTDLDLERDLGSNRVELLVAELLDTELIGEGCLHVYRHAIEALCSSDCIVIPQSATVWVQLASSQTLYNRHQLSDLQRTESDFLINVPKKIKYCSGLTSFFDVQLSELIPGKDFQFISDAKVAFTFNFSKPSTYKLFEYKLLDFVCKSDIESPFVIFMWWDLDMWIDPQKEQPLKLSCSPDWARQHNPLETDAWRDHWMQAVYYLDNTNTMVEKINRVKIGDMIDIKASHDDYSFWFGIDDELSRNDVRSPDLCRCGVHIELSRYRISMLNDGVRLSLYEDSLKDLVSRATDNESSELVVLYIGHLSYLPMILARMDAVTTIYCLDGDENVGTNRKFYNSMMSENNSTIEMRKIAVIKFPSNQNNSTQVSAISVINSDEFGDNVSVTMKRVDLIVTEPYFKTIELPWDTLHYWALLEKLSESNLLKNVRSKTNLLISSARMKCLLVKFEHLGRIRSNVGTCEGFNLFDFDDMVRRSRAFADQSVEAHPLWEYKNVSLQSEPTTLFEFDFTSSLKLDSSETGDYQTFRTRQVFNIGQTFVGQSIAKRRGVSLTFWLEYELCNGSIITTGPISDIVRDCRVEWSRQWRQGICFLGDLYDDDECWSQCHIPVDIQFNLQNGELKCLQLYT